MSSRVETTVQTNYPVLKLEGLPTRMQKITDRILASCLWHPAIKAEVVEWKENLFCYEGEHLVFAICFLLIEYVRSVPFCEERKSIETEIIGYVGEPAIQRYQTVSFEEKTLPRRVEAAALSILRERRKEKEAEWDKVQEAAKRLMAERRDSNTALDERIQALQRRLVGAISSLEEQARTDCESVGGLTDVCNALQ